MTSPFRVSRHFSRAVFMLLALAAVTVVAQSSYFSQFCNWTYTRTSEDSLRTRRGSDGRDFISGGVAVPVGEYQFTAYLIHGTKGTWRNSYKTCTASLLDERHLLTAAHCVIDDDGNRQTYGITHDLYAQMPDTLTTLAGNDKNKFIMVAVFAMEEFPPGIPNSVLNKQQLLSAVTPGRNEHASLVSVEAIYLHSHYETVTANKTDIAVLRLSESVRFSQYIRPVCLPASGDTAQDGGCTMVGYGKNADDNDNIPTSLFKVDGMSLRTIGQCRWRSGRKKRNGQSQNRDKRDGKKHSTDKGDGKKTDKGDGQKHSTDKGDSKKQSTDKGDGKKTDKGDGQKHNRDKRDGKKTDKGDGKKQSTDKGDDKKTDKGDGKKQSTDKGDGKKHNRNKRDGKKTDKGDGKKQSTDKGDGKKQSTDKGDGKKQSTDKGDGKKQSTDKGDGKKHKRNKRQVGVWDQSSGKICDVVDSSKKGTCRGDSGGPALCTTQNSASLKQFGVDSSIITTVGNPECGGVGNLLIFDPVLPNLVWLEFVALPLLRNTTRTLRRVDRTHHECFRRMNFSDFSPQIEALNLVSPRKPLFSFYYGEWSNGHKNNHWRHSLCRRYVSYSTCREHHHTPALCDTMEGIVFDPWFRIPLLPSFNILLRLINVTDSEQPTHPAPGGEVYEYEYEYEDDPTPKPKPKGPNYYSAASSVHVYSIILLCALLSTLNKD